MGAVVGCQVLFFDLAGELAVEVTMMVWLLVETLRVAGVLHSRGHVWLCVCELVELWWCGVGGLDGRLWWG